MFEVCHLRYPLQLFICDIFWLLFSIFNLILDMFSIPRNFENPKHIYKRIGFASTVHFMFKSRTQSQKRRNKDLTIWSIFLVSQIVTIQICFSMWISRMSEHRGYNIKRVWKTNTLVWKVFMLKNNYVFYSIYNNRETYFTTLVCILLHLVLKLLLD